MRPGPIASTACCQNSYTLVLSSRTNGAPVPGANGGVLFCTRKPSAPPVPVGSRPVSCTGGGQLGLDLADEIDGVAESRVEAERGTGVLGRRAIRLNHRAVTLGQQDSTRIIAAAAGIMVMVFGSFLIDAPAMGA